jgi:hypothetical protein
VHAPLGRALELQHLFTARDVYALAVIPVRVAVNKCICALNHELQHLFTATRTGITAVINNAAVRLLTARWRHQCVVGELYAGASSV